MDPDKELLILFVLVGIICRKVKDPKAVTLLDTEVGKCVGRIVALLGVGRGSTFGNILACRMAFHPSDGDTVGSFGVDCRLEPGPKVTILLQRPWAFDGEVPASQDLLRFGDIASGIGALVDRPIRCDAKQPSSKFGATRAGPLSADSPP